MTTILRDYGHTVRSHCLKVVHRQTVAEHSHGVALLCAQLYGGKPSANLLLAALYHDLPECVTGDVPATAKWRNKPLADALAVAEEEFANDVGIQLTLTDEENIALKLADLLDLGFYCIDELTYGNRHVENMFHNVKAALDRISHADITDEIQSNFFNIYKEMMKRYTNLQYAKAEYRERM